MRSSALGPTNKMMRIFSLAPDPPNSRYRLMHARGGIHWQIGIDEQQIGLRSMNRVERLSSCGIS